MTEGEDYLLLKWGSLKGWNISKDNAAALAAIGRFCDDGVCVSAALQQNTEKQKQAILDLIEAHTGTIRNDWSGDVLTKEQAKEYITSYRR